MTELSNQTMRAIFTTLEPNIRAAINRLRGWEDQDEVRQQLYVHVWQAAERYTGTGKLINYLCRVVQNKSVDMFRRAARDKARHDSYVASMNNIHPWGTMEDVDSCIDAERAVSDIHDRYRSIFMHRVTGRHPGEEIPPGTVSNGLRRIRVKLQEYGIA